jgi:NAD-dependent SIR2 family protein deacetylase
MPHPLALILVQLGVAAVLGGFYVGVAGTVADNVETFKEDAPAAASELEKESEIARDFKQEERVTTFVDELDERLGTTAQVQRSTSTLIGLRCHRCLDHVPHRLRQQARHRGTRADPRRRPP